MISLRLHTHHSWSQVWVCRIALILLMHGKFCHDAPGLLREHYGGCASSSMLDPYLTFCELDLYSITIRIILQR